MLSHLGTLPNIYVIMFVDSSFSEVASDLRTQETKKSTLKNGMQLVNTVVRRLTLLLLLNPAYLMVKVIEGGIVSVFEVTDGPRFESDPELEVWLL